MIGGPTPAASGRGRGRGRGRDTILHYCSALLCTEERRLLFVAAAWWQQWAEWLCCMEGVLWNTKYRVYGVQSRGSSSKNHPTLPFSLHRDGSEPSRDQGQVNRYLASFMNILIWRYIRIERVLGEVNGPRGWPDLSSFFLFFSDNNKRYICVITHNQFVQYRYSLPLLHSNNTLPSSGLHNK